jgi:hypothetical protein
MYKIIVLCCCLFVGYCSAVGVSSVPALQREAQTKDYVRAIVSWPSHASDDASGSTDDSFFPFMTSATAALTDPDRPRLLGGSFPWFNLIFEDTPGSQPYVRILSRIKCSSDEWARFVDTVVRCFHGAGFPAVDSNVLVYRLRLEGADTSPIDRWRFIPVH